MAQVADQIRQLADLFSIMSDTLDNFRTLQFDELAPEERLRLDQLFQQLCDIHDQLTSFAIEATLNEMQSDLVKVVALTGEAQRSLQHLKAVAQITTLVSAAANLAGDVVMADYGAIPEGIDSLVKAIRQDPEQTSTES